MHSSERSYSRSSAVSRASCLQPLVRPLPPTPTRSARRYRQQKCCEIRATPVGGRTPERPVRPVDMADRTRRFVGQFGEYIMPTPGSDSDETVSIVQCKDAAMWMLVDEVWRHSPHEARRSARLRRPAPQPNLEKWSLGT